MPEEIQGSSFTSETPPEGGSAAPVTPEGSPPPSDGGTPPDQEDRSGWVRPEQYQRWVGHYNHLRQQAASWEAQRQELERLREQQNRLVEAVAPKGTRLTPDQQQTLDALYTLAPHLKHTARLTPQHLDVLDQLAQRPDLIPRLVNRLEQFSQQDATSRQVAGRSVDQQVAKFAKDNGLSDGERRVLEKAALADIIANTQDHAAFTSGNAQVAWAVVEKYLPTVLQDLRGSRQLQQEVAREERLTTTQNLPPPPTRGAPAGGRPPQPDDSDEFDHKGAWEDLMRTAADVTRT